ncbi:nuclear transport factor 2 family protein [Mesorhizobium sp. M1E.F.Ca.ET.041.01.1.1]|uniref:nuclear transport factor 2 family protein n=1 Tax=Mesorhizobium sp. M1E.F.Ca.ET.041.01.1.1 TaxID=2496759 RepID=UPI000FCB22E7|nr:nuclear transport factor 2 family protein [Mesorhizobium sp. M1E.F.Ca.ET.041.01.1.1]RUW36315.1 nuclear transport factor 2 family protein [Mesorhizobium sp. M1E.F.Ca.ET.041.01.1.1]
MTATDVEFLEILTAEREIKNVMHSYVRGCDRKDYDRVRDAYHEDAFDDHGPIKALKPGLMEWIQNYNKDTHQMMHLISEPYIEWHGQIASVETYCLLIQQMNSTVGDQENSPRYCTQAVRYADRFEKHDGKWRIAHRVVIYEAIRDEEATPPPAGAVYILPEWTKAVRSLQDPIYTVLTAKPMEDDTGSH